MAVIPPVHLLKQLWWLLVPHVAVVALPAVLVCPCTVHVLFLFWQAAHTFLRKEHIQGQKNSEFKSMELLKNKVLFPLPMITTL